MQTVVRVGNFNAYTQRTGIFIQCMMDLCYPPLEGFTTDNNINILAEFGIGLNPKATLIGNTLLDEKSLGTAHIALGMNTVFGGINNCSYHLDQIFKNPKILVDGKILKI